MNLLRIRKLPALTISVLIFYLLFTTGCNLLSNESEERLRVPGTLTVTFVEEDSLGRNVSNIDAFEVPQPPAVPLDNTLKTKVDPEVFKSATVYFKEKDNSAGAVVFLFGTNPADGQIVTSSGSFSPSTHTFFTTARAEPLTNDVELHAFFVEGIGEAPAKPINLIIDPTQHSATELELRLDPQKHTLPAHYALNIDENDIGTLPPSWHASIRLKNEKETELQPEDPYVLFASRLSNSRGNDWNGSVVRGGLQYGFTLEKPTKDFDCIVIILD